MKRISLVKEAERLNLPLDVVLKSQNKLLRERKIQGIIDTETNELVSYTADELDVIVELLNDKITTFKDFSLKYELSIGQSKLLINDLLKRNKISGLLKNKEFIPSEKIEELILKSLEKIGEIDPSGAANKLDIPIDNVRNVITKIEKQTADILSPYSNIKISDLGKEVGISESLTISFLKRLIKKKQISGSIDRVNNILTLEKNNKDTKQVKSYNPPIMVNNNYKPSGAWYLVPLIFGILGGIFAYYSVKDDDHSMAESLLAVGFLRMIIGILFLLVQYSWYLSFLRSFW